MPQSGAKSRAHQEPAKLSTTHAPFEKRLNDALQSPTLETALTRALPIFRQRRDASLADGDFHERQQALARRRAAGVDRLPELVEQFKASAEAVGATVHMAKTAEDARRIIGEIAAERGAKLAVKSKSMAAEEVDLNPHLESQGIEVVETDLGEWIIQLAGEHPSHLLAPALHKTREQIAELFSQASGQDLSPDDLNKLVSVAREQLRQSFIDADVGISGVNIAIADSGTLVILSNEGNGRLVTTLPPVHIALMGIDKIVPTLDDATEILKMLAPSATGQKMSVYVSFITGPSRSADIELSLTIGVHGPKELHIVLLDNGRWEMRDDPRFREALQCIRCGACANVCPPFQVVGGHVFGHVYSGPIGLVVTKFHHGMEHAADPQSLCVSCNACETICPVGIPLARQILDLRRQKVSEQGLPWTKRKAIETLSRPAQLDRLTRLAGTVASPFVDKNGSLSKDLLRFIPGLWSQAGWRNLPAPARRPFRDRLRDLDKPEKPRQIAGSQATGTRVAYFPGCMTDRLYPSIGEAAVRVLQACGCQVFFPPEQSCCGLPAVNAGDEALAIKMFKQTIAALESQDADYILSTSASCAVSMVQDFPHFLADEPDWLARAQGLASRVIDFVTFMERVAKLPAGALAIPETPTLTYHDSCQSHNCLRLHSEQRRLLRDVVGCNLVEMKESSACCGFGGSFSFDHPGVAERVVRRKLEHIDETNAGVVVTDNPGCILHLRGATQASDRPIRVAHLAEIMADRLPR